MRRHQTRPTHGRQPPFYGGVDSGQTLPHVSVVEAEGPPCMPNGVACANTRTGDAQLFALLAETTAQAAPAEVTVGCEATGPSWLHLYEALLAQGSPVRVLNPL